jgi:hypothetical protein
VEEGVKFLHVFNEYDLKARIAPGLVLSVPVLVTAIFLAPETAHWPVFAAGSVPALAIIYALGQFARFRGRAIEPPLWASWGGAPSTRYLRHSDATFGAELKNRLQSAVARQFSMRLSSEHEEATDPERADQRIEDVFRRVRPHLRHCDPKGLWFDHDIEYGFCRNLLGSRVVWVALAIAGSATAGLVGASRESGALNPATVINAFCAVIAVFVGWFLLPVGTKHVAETYAESAWMGFLLVVETPVDRLAAGKRS